MAPTNRVEVPLQIAMNPSLATAAETRAAFSMAVAEGRIEAAREAHAPAHAWSRTPAQGAPRASAYEAGREPCPPIGTTRMRTAWVRAPKALGSESLE